MPEFGNYTSVVLKFLFVINLQTSGTIYDQKFVYFHSLISIILL